MAKKKCKEPIRESWHTCPGCGYRIPAARKKELKIVCQACLYALHWKGDDVRGGWVLAILE